MKIISFGDIHEDFGITRFMKKELQSADLIIITGDLTNYHGRKEAQMVIEGIMEFNEKILAQFGNLDTSEVNDYLNEKKINLHGNGYVINEIGIFGAGGSNPTPFQTPSEFSEHDIEAFLKTGFEKVQSAKWKIMVPHAPPHGTKIDVIGNGTHVGSQSVRDFIRKYKPEISLSGHIHEARGSDILGKTRLFNAGMYREGGYIEIQKQSDGLTAELKIIE